MSIDTVSSKGSIMKITVFGATGKIGRLVVAQALEQGHEVTAFARNPQKVEQTHANLQVVQGDVLDYSAVEKAIIGRDAIVAALGMPLMNNEKLRSKGTANIIRAMETTGVKRLICLSGLGAGDSMEILPFHYKYLLAPLIFRRVFADHTLKESYIKNSQLDWIIVRPANFTKGAYTGKYREDIKAGDKPPRLRISHHDVADFLVRQLSDDTYLHKTPVISY